LEGRKIRFKYKKKKKKKRGVAGRKGEGRGQKPTRGGVTSRGGNFSKGALKKDSIER